MLEIIERMVSDLNLNICETIQLLPRTEARSPAPTAIVNGPVGSAFAGLGGDGTLWSHQSSALELLCAGSNVVVSTGTASGKSLIFQLYALHLLLTEPGSRALVFYPLRALTADQLASWRRIVATLGMQPHEVDIIYGGIPAERREQILEQARIVLMTPDVCQAWFMRTLDNAVVRRFLDALALLVLDEAHVYESVFGSNAAFLMRRLLAAKRRLPSSGRSPRQRQLQIIAATATIAEARQHLEQLTGLPFHEVDESQNGAPAHPRQVLHIEGPDFGPDGGSVIADIGAGICNLASHHRFIAFMDSRQGVEGIVLRMGRENVKPYRSGYESGDRQAIEQALRNGSLQGVVSTSALELGIDIPDLEVGINLGVPQSRKSFRQRLGRIGRTQPGVFLIVASRNAFKQFGENLSEYYDGSIEPSYLYLGNRFVQFAHARCFRDEMEALGRESGSVPGGIAWPDGFAEVLGFAREGWSREFDPVAQIGGGSPHINYPLRQIVDPSYKLQLGSGDFAREIGYIALNQAIREAYPGGIYLHAGRAYRVSRWRYGFGDHAIQLNPAANPTPIRPILREAVTVDISREGVVAAGRIKRTQSGLLAEVQVQVNESVEGYRIGSTQHRYRDLRANNPNMRRQQRDFRTTGIIMQISDAWFADASVRSQIANGLKDVLCRDRSIASQDIDATHTNIAIRTAAGSQRITDAVVVYDSVHGGLRLTEHLFNDFGRYVNQLVRAAGLAGDDATVTMPVAEHLLSWSQSLANADVDSLDIIRVNVPDGWLQVFKPGSIVGVFINPNIVERELIEPVYRDFFDTGQPELYYSYQTDSGARFTPHQGIEAVGQDWEWVLWNPQTGEYRDLETTG